MLKIKLSRTGKNKQAHFRIVVNEARDRRDGKYVEMIGHYAPSQQPKILEIKKDRYEYWISKGAQATPTVENLFKRFESGNPFPEKKKKLSKKAKAKLEESNSAKQNEEVKEKVEEVKEAEVSAEPVTEAQEAPQE